MKVTITGRMSKRKLQKLLRPCERERVVTRVVTYSFNGASFTAKGDNMSLVLKDTDLPGTVTATIQFINSKGNPAKVDGVPSWNVSEPLIIDSVAPSADGMSALLHITNVPGASLVGVRADVDLGPGVRTHEFVDTISVIADEAVAANFLFGAVTPDV